MLRFRQAVHNVVNIGICGQLYNQKEETPVHERVDRLDMWIAIRGMINQKKIFLWIQETVDREMREANRVGFFCCRVCTITCV